MKNSGCRVSDILFLFQGINVLEQEKLDNVMIEMDGTDNKCKPHHMYRDDICVMTYFCTSAH